MSDADAKDYASTKHKGLPNHVKKENMEKELKEIIRQTYRDSLREFVNEAKNTQPKNDWGKRLVEAIYNNVSAIDSLVNKDKKDVKDIMSNFGNPLINSIKETIKYNYKPHPIAGGHFNPKRKDNKYPEETYNKETIKQFKLQLAGLLKIAEFLNTKPSKSAVKKLVDMWRDIWNFRGGAEIALSGDMYNSIYESVNEDAAELPQATIPSAVKAKLQMAIDKIKDSKLNNNAKLQLVAQVVDALGVDKSQLSNIANKIRSKMESVNEAVSHEAMGIAKWTNTRQEAVQKFIDDNDLDAKEILKDVTKGGLVERVRFIQALVGTPGNSSFKWYVKNYANESVVNEGKKAFKVNPPIGKAKYSISSHNGSSTHNDGSDFWDIKIFKNKVDLEKGIKDFKSKGFIEEGVEMNEDIKSDINKFLDKLNKQFPEQEYTTDFKGGKYARIVQQSRKYSGNRSAWGFVAMEDNPSKGFKKGDLLKAAGFNTPAKGARGNILDGTAKYDKWSPVYLR